MIAYEYPITDHLGPGPSVAFSLRDDKSCLVESKSNGKTGFYFVKVIPPDDEPKPKNSCLQCFPLLFTKLGLPGLLPTSALANYKSKNLSNVSPSYVVENQINEAR